MQKTVLANHAKTVFEVVGSSAALFHHESLCFAPYGAVGSFILPPAFWAALPL